jgi:uncharacterized repeat protein (TIGR04076 family)
MTTPNTTTETTAGAAPATMAPARPPTTAPATTTSATTAAPAATAPLTTTTPAAPGFELYDLRVEVVGPPDKPIYCGAKLGDYFELHGEMLKFPPGQGFSIYSLAALLPLLPAKQRVTDPNDWMTSDAEVACPDPNCPTRFRITRTGRRYFKRSDTTAVPLPTLDSR